MSLTQLPLAATRLRSLPLCPMQQILILDFGSQYTQLIARRIRELHVFCEIHPYTHAPQLAARISAGDDSLRGVILSGSPCSVACVERGR